MLNLILYKRGIKENIKIVLIFAAVLTMYFTIMISMFDPALGSILTAFIKAMPEIMNMFGMNLSSTTLTGFMSTYLYGFIMLVFPMIFSIINANRLVARHVAKGSMVYLLSAPVSRKTIVFTQMKVLGSGLFFLILYATVFGIAACETSFPGELEIPKFILLNVGAFGLHLLIAGICFLSSCIFNETKHSIAIGAGIPALAYVIQMLAKSGEALSYAKYATFFTLFNPEGIIAGDTVAFIQMLVLFLSAFIIFAISVIVFTRKDMPI